MPSLSKCSFWFAAASLATAHERSYKSLESYNHEVKKLALDYDTNQFIRHGLCTCDEQYPHCASDNWCYKDSSRRHWSTQVCPGNCAAGYGVDIQHNIPKVNITYALEDLGKLRRDAEEAVNATKAYKTWLFHDATTVAYQDHQAEQIKKFAFKAVDEARGRLEEHLSGQVTAVSALSAKLAGEPGGGTPDEQAELTKLLATVEKDRDALEKFGLSRKIAEMHLITRLMEKAEFDRDHDIRKRGLHTRLDWLRASRRAMKLLRRWDGNHEDHFERKYGDDAESIFDQMEHTTEANMDEAHDKIQDVYSGVKRLVHHRIKLLTKAAKASSNSDDFAFYE